MSAGEVVGRRPIKPDDVELCITAEANGRAGADSYRFVELEIDWAGNNNSSDTPDDAEVTAATDDTEVEELAEEEERRTEENLLGFLLMQELMVQRV